MILESLTLQRLLRFHDPVTLDCTTLPPGLIAVVGPNGAGKTTLLEAPIAALYRRFPSRGHEVVDYATDRDAEIEVTFSRAGDGRYRARLLLDGIKRQTSAVLERLSDPPAVLTDGRVTSYDRWIADALPPYALLVASAFAAQNHAGSFVALDRRGRKELFAQLLGLGHYETMAQTARGAAALLDRGRDQLRSVMAILAREGNPLRVATLRHTRAAVFEQLTTAEALQQIADQRVLALDAERAERQHIRDALETATRDLQAAEQRRATLAAERARIVQARTAVPTTRDAQLRELRERTATERGQLMTRLQNNERLLRDADEAGAIRAAASALAELDPQIAQATSDRDRRRQRVDARQTTLTQLQRAHADTTTALERAHEDAGLLGRVPCGGAEPYADCQFLVRARAAQNRLGRLEEQHRRETEQVAAAETASRRDATAAQRAEAALQTLLERRLGLQAQAARAPQLAAAEARIEELRQALVSLGARSVEETGRIRQQARTDQQQLAQQLREIDQQITAVNQALTALREAQAQWAAAPSYAAWERDLRLAHDAQLAATTETTRLQGQFTHATDVLVAAEAQQAEAADTRQRLEGVETELVDWQLLARAFSREGLPTLEMDSAGPTVASYTNDLLHACFGARFTVDLVTQEAKASGKGLKEVFELKVFDGFAGGEPRDLTDLSGGEQVIVDEALKNALALYVNTRAASPWQTCWRDETTGALDASNARHYVAMLRRLRERGGFHQIVFVTHAPDAAALADAQIQILDGSLTVALPPYVQPPQHRSDTGEMPEASM